MIFPLFFYKKCVTVSFFFPFRFQNYILLLLFLSSVASFENRWLQFCFVIASLTQIGWLNEEFTIWRASTQSIDRNVVKKMNHSKIFGTAYNNDKSVDARFSLFSAMSQAFIIWSVVIGGWVFLHILVIELSIVIKNIEIVFTMLGLSVFIKCCVC